MVINVIGKNSKTVKVIKDKSDDFYLRATIGGEKSKGYYCVVTGNNWHLLEEMLEETLWAFKEAKKIYEKQK